MAWQRSVKPGEPARVTFLVKESDDPELYRWLVSLPYGKSSGLVRGLLGAAIRGTPLDSMQERSTEATRNEPGQPRQRIVETPQQPEHPDHGQTEQQNTNIVRDVDTDKLFRNMKDQFK